MKKFLLALLLIATFQTSFGQQPDDLTLTLPTGKVITFQTSEQKARFQAAQAAAVLRGQAAVKTQQAKQQELLKQSPPATRLGHTALDELPKGTGVANVTAPMFSADYYMGSPDSWVGKKITLSVAYVNARNEADRQDGMRQLEASTWGISPGVIDQNPGGRLTILAPPAAALHVLQMCGTSLQFNASGVKTALIKGEFTVLVKTSGSSAGSKEYGLIVDQ